MRGLSGEPPDLVDPLDGGGGRFREHRIEVEDGVDLRTFEWSGKGSKLPPVLLVAGWITIVDSWAPVLGRLAQTRRVMDNLVIVLDGLGLGLEHVLSARVFRSAR